MKTIWLFLARLGTFLYLRLGVYRLWSNIYRAIWERRFRDIPLKIFMDLKELGRYLQENSGKWKADSWKQLFDAVSYPAKAQEVFDGRYEATEGLDCDDYSAYITNVLDLSLAVTQLPVANPRFFTVTWMNGWKVGGHNVALVAVPDGGYAYMDYGMPTGHALTPDGVARNVINSYAGKEAVCIVWCVAKKDLSPLVVHWG